MAEVLTKDLLNRLFAPRNDLDRQMWRAIDQDDELERRCPKCHGKGMWTQLEDSKFGNGLKVENWYRCDVCRLGKVPARAI